MTAAIILVSRRYLHHRGGLAAVIYTDLVQTLILLAGAIALTFIGLDKSAGLPVARPCFPRSIST